MNMGRTGSKNIGGVKLGIHGIRLACVNHKEQLVIPFRRESMVILEDRETAHLFFCHICSNASAKSNALISSLS